MFTLMKQKPNDVKKNALHGLILHKIGFWSA